MGAIFSPPRKSRDLSPLPPLPPNDARWKERDRFGLAVWPLSLIAESAEERDARIATVERLVIDVFKTAAAHLGQHDAKRLFAEASKAPWKYGKQPNRAWNDELLAKYDSRVDQEPDNIRSIPRRVANELNPNNPGNVPATEKRIRQLVKDRSRRQTQSPRSLLHDANSSKRDI